VNSIDRIERIASAAEATDGVAPLDEATWLALRHRPDQVRCWVRDDAFALLIRGELSVVVHPEARRRGVGGRLLAEVLADIGDASSLAAWLHGDHPAAHLLAERHCFDRVRELWVMRRPLSVPLPELIEPDGVTLRGFRPGDEDELLRVNSRAFVGHPEQGAMDAANLAERMAEPWFDPEGLIVAVAGDRMLGFHWTKQHSPELGEVYVVAIAPEAQGRGLGGVLTLAGLHHLADRGVSEVLLYVESDNRPAIAVYRRLGFGHEARDTPVMYARRTGRVPETGR
jgi:mycothiol synthase